MQTKTRNNAGMNALQKLVIKTTVNVMLKIQAFMFRHAMFNTLGYRLNSFVARATIKKKRIGMVKTLDELGECWQRGFPAKKEVPITGKDDNTIYGEIRTKCPLRGTGDVAACYKMMSYDREIVSSAGGQFIVLQSQAESGIEKCKVAMRFKNENVNDLQHAHERSGTLSGRHGV